MNLTPKQNKLLDSLSRDLSGIKNNLGTIAKRGDPAEKKQEPPPEVTAIVALQSGVQTETEPQATGRISRDKWRLVVEVGTMFAVIWYGCVAAQQRDEMRKSTSATESATEIAAQQIRISANGVAQSVHAMHQDQRPWLMFDFADNATPHPVPRPSTLTLTLAVGAPITLPVRFTNVGKTPAQDVFGYGVVQLVRVGKAPVILDDTDPDKVSDRVPSGTHVACIDTKKCTAFATSGFETGVVYANNFVNSQMTRVKSGPKDSIVDDPLSAAEADALRNGELYFSIYGTVTYRDGFGVQHWTRFCLSQSPAGKEVGSPNCTHYAAVDNHN